MHMQEAARDVRWIDEQSAASARRISSSRLRVYMVTDFIGVVLGFVAALVVATTINHWFVGYVPGPIDGLDGARVLQISLVALGVLFWFEYKNSYRVRMNSLVEAQLVLSTFAFAMMADGFLQFAAKNDISRLWLASGWLFAGVMVLILRGLYRHNMRLQGKWDISTLLVGAGKTASAARKAITNDPVLGYQIVSQIDHLPQAFLAAGRSWARLCQQHNAQHVMIALDGAELDGAASQIAQLTREAIPFCITPPHHHLPVMDMTPQYFFGRDITLLSYSSGLEQPLPRFLKRIFDVVVAGGMLVVLSPVMLGVALAVASDGGAVFYRQMRIGKNGKPFGCLKFRSMVRDSQKALMRYLSENPSAREEWEADHKLKHDPRITAVGRVIRKTSMDELPQLINVLRGEMSLVGPRPIVAGEVPKYANDIAHYYRVSPGITGLWQVSGRNDVSYEERVQMDSWYVRNWSLWHDVAILVKTIPALLGRNGAY